MEPKMPAGSPEQMPSPVEYTPSVPGFERSAEASPERNHEKAPEHQGEQHRAVTATPVPVQLPTPTVVSDDNSSVAAPSVLPPVAADEDLIEKEWVDSAKKVIEATKDDPYAREREVSKLKVDYIQKRYGKTLGSSE